MEKREGNFTKTENVAHSLCGIFVSYYRLMINLSGNLALQELAGPVKNLKPVLVKCLQFQIQSQLQRELIGCQRLVRQGRVSLSRDYSNI